MQHLLSLTRRSFVRNSLGVAIVASCLAGATAHGADTFVRMVSGPSGGSWYPLGAKIVQVFCLLYTSPSPRDGLLSRMPSSA